MAAASAAAAPGDARVVYLGNLNRDADEASTTAFIHSSGARVDHIDRRRGYAFVTYASVGDAERAIAALNGKEFQGRVVKAESSRPLTDRPPRPAREPRAPRAPAAAGGGAAAAGGAGADGEPRRYYDRRIIVRGLPREFTSENLASAFTSCGKVLRARVIGNRGQVSFETAEAATTALSLSGTKVGETAITVTKEAMRPRRKKTAEGADGAPAAGGAGASGAPRAPRAPKKVAAAGGAGAGAGAASTEPRVPRPTRRVRVEGLVTGMSSDVLKTLFATIGEISSAKVIEGKNRGFITFVNADDVPKALALSGTQVGDHKLTITLDAKAPRVRKPAGAAAAAGGAGGAPAAPREPRDLTNTVWVTGLAPEKMEEGNLRRLFSSFGAIDSVTILGSRAQSAYVKYASPAAVTAAAGALNGTTVEGADRPLRVEAASGVSKYADRRRGGDRRGAPAAAGTA